jgi:hypothetical protein
LSPLDHPSLSSDEAVATIADRAAGLGDEHTASASLAAGPRAALILREIHAADLARHPAALQSLFDGETDGLLVRGLFDPALMARVAQRIDEGRVPRRIMGDQAGLPEVPFTVGQAIVGVADELDDYFADAALQSERIRQLFAEEADFEAQIAEALSTLGGGLPVQRAHGPAGEPCPTATIRVLPEGAEIGVHVDNSFLHMPRARHLHRLVDTRGQLSYFVPLSVPEAGGELMVYTLQWAAAKLFMPDVAQASANVWLEGSEVHDLVTRFEHGVFAPGVGDLLIFDGGRHFHRVSKVVGPTLRRTIGGFLGLAPAHDALYVWS